MIKKVVKGDIYAVATESECVVTSSTGKPLGTATAGNPITFPATTDEVEISDPDADFIRVNPNYAPAKLMLYGLLGRGVQSVLPSGYLAAYFLESTGSQWIDSELVVTEETRISIDFFIVTKKSWGAIFGWRDSLNQGFYCREYNTTDQLSFNIGAYHTEQNYTPAARNSVTVDIASNKITVNGKDITFNKTTFSEDKLSLYVFGHHFKGGANGAIMRCYDCNLSDGITERQYLPSIDKNGVPCLYDIVNKKPFYNNGTGAFIAGLTLKQALQLSKLPATGGSLTVSLPWEAQLLITGVPDALQTAANNGWTITVQYRAPEADNTYYNKYAACTKVADMRVVNANYKSDLTTHGEWIYPLPLISDAHDMLCENIGLTAVSTNMPMCTSAIYAFAHCPNLTLFSGSLQSLQNGYEMMNNSRQFKYFYASVPVLSNGLRMFNNCILDKESALNVLNSIPTYTSGSHLLTIGIHIDHQTDEEVIAAISAAETKGWNVTVQWNGSPTAQTASTFGLRSPTIYAKLGTVERPDGTSEAMLDWGHYVTDWEANGYQEFSSVEEAKEYFNIKETNHETF